MGKGGSQTVGYKYNVGMHLVVCHGPIDKITRASVDNKTAWQGEIADGSITINAPELFGGEDREGGVAGIIDVMMGRPDQGRNPYLQKMLGTLIPAYRGVVSLVFRGSKSTNNMTGGQPIWVGILAPLLGLGRSFYQGNSPYLKPWSFRGQRVYVRQDGIEQWYPEKAGITSTGTILYPEGKQATLTWWQGYNTYVGDVYAKTGFLGFAFYNENGVLISATNAPDIQVPMWTQRTFSATIPAGCATIKIRMEWHNEVGVGFYQTTFDDVSLSVDGVPVNVLCPSFEPKEDVDYAWPSSDGFGGETRGPGGSNPGWPEPPHSGTAYFHGGLGSGIRFSRPLSYPAELDMNPAHIIRECLTDPLWGMGYADEDIDEDSFIAAADTLYAEAMGISLLWEKQAKLEDFINEVIKHIDAALFVSRTTGKFVLKLIRSDYEVAGLPTFDESNIKKVTNPSRAAPGELVNSVSVAFWNMATGKADSVTVQDPASVQQQGSTINAPVSYLGFTNLYNAQRAGARDLRALSNPFLNCVITAGEEARGLDVGNVILFSWKKWQIENKPMRITGYALAEGLSTEVRLTVTEDVFSTPDVSVMEPPAEEWENPSQPPDPVTQQVAFEVPYYELAQAVGQEDLDPRLIANPLLGYVGAAAARPRFGINAKLWTDAGDGFKDADTMDFCPTGVLVGDLTKTATAAVLEDGTDLADLTVGEHFQIGDELLRLDTFDIETGEITFARGVLDTVPAEHSAGDTAYFWDTYFGFDETQYSDGETVDERITPASGAGVVQIADAANMQVTLDQRAWRPYPPGNLRINGDRYLNQNYEEELTVTWSHRDRLQQTSGELVDDLDGDIGPEAGTLYRVRIWVDGVLDTEEDDIAGTEYLVTPTTGGVAKVEVHSKRDGLYSMFAPSHSFPYTSGDARFTEEGDVRLTEEGDIRVTED